MTMRNTVLWVTSVTACLMLSGTTNAQQSEAVYAFNFNNTANAKIAMDVLFEDEAMADSRVTLYVARFGNVASSHLVVVDFDNYDEFMEQNAARVASHGWAKYLLATQDSEFVGGDLLSVVADHGAPRYSAGYLVAYLINTTDPAGYAAAISDLNDAVDNPGVLRLVAFRSGDMAATHAVLIGGENFAAVAGYLDKLFASDAFDDFVSAVGDTRKVVGVQWFERVATWGD